MKKLVISLVLVVLISSVSLKNLEAQEIQNAVFIDFTPTLIGFLTQGFGVGLAYERAFLDNLSLNVPFWFVYSGIADATIFVIRIGAEARFYPLATAVKGLFLGAGAEYLFLTGSNEDDNQQVGVPILSATAGWKFVFSSGFFLELGLRYSYPIFPEEITDDTRMFSGLLPWLGLGLAF